MLVNNLSNSILFRQDELKKFEITPIFHCHNCGLVVEKFGLLKNLAFKTEMAPMRVALEISTGMTRSQLFFISFDERNRTEPQFTRDPPA